MSNLNVDGRNHHLGCFATPEEAGEVFQQARVAKEKGRIEAFLVETRQRLQKVKKAVCHHSASSAILGKWEDSGNSKCY